MYKGKGDRMNNYRMSDSAPLYALIIALSPIMFVGVMIIFCLVHW